MRSNELHLSDLRDGLAIVEKRCRDKGQAVPILAANGDEIARIDLASRHPEEAGEFMRLGKKISGTRMRKLRGRMLHGCWWGNGFLIARREADLIAFPPDSFPHRDIAGLIEQAGISDNQVDKRDVGTDDAAGHVGINTQAILAITDRLAEAQRTIGSLEEQLRRAREELASGPQARRRQRKVIADSTAAALSSEAKPS